jgi:hypothetical protein
MTRLSAPIFRFGDQCPLPLEDSHTRPQDLADEVRLLALSGPSSGAAPSHLPVRGDLAHIKLAGRYFVPHYAVPMPHRVVAETALRIAGKRDADAMCDLPEGALFDVLDISGGWAWGQFGEDGPVGYVPLGSLEAA